MSTLKSKVAAGAFAISTIFAAQAQTSANDDKLMAMNEPVKTEAVNEKTYSVGVKDLRGQRDRLVQTYAARVSNDAIVVLFRGDDIDLFNRVRAGASEAKDSGIYVRGIVLGRANSEHTDLENSFVIYSNGQAVTKFGDAADPEIERMIKELIEWADEKHLQPTLKNEAQNQVVLNNDR